MNNNQFAMFVLLITVIGICFSVSIACYVTKSALPLIGLVFIPSFKYTDKE